VLKRGLNVKPPEMCEVTNRIGEGEIESTLIKLGFKTVGKKSDLDAERVDYTFQRGLCQINVQLKSKNISKRNSFAFDIFRRGESLDLKFYSEPNSFLFLSGVEIKRQERTFVETALSTNLLIPGQLIVKHFEETSPGTHQITMYKQKLLDGEYKWSRYCGPANIEDVLADEQKRQEDEEEMIRKYREQKRSGLSQANGS
jgi:hypothetical protein